MSTLGQRVKEVRERAALTQSEFAKQIGVNPSKISKVESDEQELQGEQLANIASRFGTDLNWLIAGIASPNSVKESGKEYFTRPNLRAIIASLEKADVVTLALIQDILKKEPELATATDAVSKALGITKEKALLQLLAQKDC